jgi:hypothetical protein
VTWTGCLVIIIGFSVRSTELMLDVTSGMVMDGAGLAS